MSRTKMMMSVAGLAAFAVGLSGVAPATADNGGGESSEVAAEAEPLNAATSPGSATRFSDVGAAGPKDTQKVTLITGDQVWFTRLKDASGRMSVSTRIEAAKRPGGEKVSFVRWGTSDKYYVVPSDMLPLLGSRVDRALFDVAGLIDSGANASESTRVIVSFPNTTTVSARSLEATARTASAKVRATDTTVLASANAVAMAVPAGKAWDLLDNVAPASAGPSSSDASFVSLDAQVKAMDETSMPQIGAPKAWKSGYTGKGVKVAVLDTGIDSTHPDLKGQVVKEANFSVSWGDTDKFGHGTHVASIIAGAASNPDMRGVAYQAKLFNVKVLSDAGSGSASDIVEGMEWAAKNGADVINMSLGGGPGDGTNIMETSVNALTKKYGVVFAISAGNGGRSRDGGVSSPSTADAAISVAAVDSENNRTPWSDSGPRTGDAAMKPDVAAPGLRIRAARSKVNVFGRGSGKYIRLSGTSMAAPHVAGAAALLAQARPDLSGTELKSVLMGGATDRSANIWQEGAGVINIEDSIGMPVVPREGSLSYGAFAYPQSARKPATKTIHYRNTTSKAVTLNLKADAADAKGAKATGVSLSTTAVTVPAKGTAAVRVTVTPGADGVGLYAGAVTATPGTGPAVRTILGWKNNPQLFDVRVKALDHSGRAGSVQGYLQNVDSDEDPMPIPNTDTRVMRLPAGDYFFGGFTYPRGTSKHPKEITLAIQPEVRIKANTTITLGGKTGRQLSALTPKPSSATGWAASYERGFGKWDRRLGFAAVSEGLTGGLWVTPAATPKRGKAFYLEQLMQVGPGSKPAYDYQLAFPTAGGIPTSSVRRVSSKQLATSIGNYRTSVKDGSAISYWKALAGGNAEFATLVTRRVKIPATVTSYLSTGGVKWMDYADGPQKYTSSIYIDGESYEPNIWRTHRAGSTTRNEYFSAIRSPGLVSGGYVFRDMDAIYVRVPRFEDAGGHPAMFYSADFRSTFDGYVGTKKVFSETLSTDAWFDVPKNGRILRIVQTEKYRANWWKPRTAMIGEWTGPIPTRDGIVPMLNVQYKLTGQSTTGSVPSGRQSVGLTVTGFPNPKYARTAVITPKTLTLEWSVDGGNTWKPASVRSKGKTATATFTPPTPAAGASTEVSLRATASDGKGSTVKETVIAAYEMTGPAK